MAFDSAFLDELRNRTPLTSLIGRRNKLVRSGRNWKICCPFHGEKTPSFYIYDDHFHCFGCGAHGDAISYVMQSEGRSFLEAVESLAGEAGLEVPKQDPKSAEKANEVKSLTDVLMLVQASYRRRLFRNEGQDGLAYLRRRGLTDETIERFGLGWSGDGRSLVEEMRTHNVTPEMLVRAGLMRVDENGNPKGELFFNRVTFPIRDRRGRLISFGARTLWGGQPKYLNGPETLLFSKRRTLFNLDLAREAVHNGAELVVVEGYMDVIALDQAGIKGGVAPLGTALGSEQLELMWRMSPSPIMCLDGDAAGARAALRTCEVALPLLSSGRTLRFCRLDPKDDPDSLIRTRGVEAMRDALAHSTTLVSELFALVTAGMIDPTPEQRAALRDKLISLSKMVPDRSLAGEYRSSLLDMFFERYRKKWKAKNGSPQMSRSYSGLDAPKTLHIEAGADKRLRILTALLLQHPNIFPDVEQAYTALNLPKDLDHLRGVFLDWVYQNQSLTHENCREWLEKQGVYAEAQALVEKFLPRDIEKSENRDDVLSVEVSESWWHFYGLVNFRNFEQEVTNDIQSAIMKAYTEDHGVESSFPESLLARMRVLEALRRGESI
ncbi:DNA primase [Swingsia samuiensis]|uniref:DNA primase n=1 Tax=Swingsia samuiensis TaxID=1293412 RepID=A0A4Y6UIY0_9PROT|nr:DNA primase [Swingsia samuiensis]QDH16426.1 DNA primase [Swingsia samuiensis]